MDKAEAVELLTSASIQMEQTVNQMLETDGVNLMMHFISLNESIAISKYNIKNILNPLYLNPFASKNFFSKEEDLSFDTPFGNYGTYTWNSSLSSWDFVATPVDKIIYLFPSNQTQTENNANITFANIEQVVDLDNFIKRFDLIIKIGQQVVLGVYYSTTLTESYIDKVTIDINLPPFTITANQIFKRSNGGSLVTSSFTTKNQGIAIMSSNFEIGMDGEIMISPDNYEEIENVQVNEVIGYIRIGNVKLTLDLDLMNFSSETDISPSELEMLANKNLKVKLYEYPSGVSLAYVKWYFNTDKSFIEPFLVYSDGSEEGAINYIPESIQVIFNFEEDLRVGF